MDQQNTDPWEIALNKEIEYTVYFEVDVNDPTVVLTLANVITALQAQQPLIARGDATFNIRLISCKLWGVPGGDCLLTPYEITGSTTATAEIRVTKYDVGDGVTRPTVDYSWTTADRSWLLTGTNATLIGILLAQVGPGNSTNSRGGLLYVKLAMHSNTSPRLPVPAQLASGIEDMNNKCKRKFDEDCKKIAVKRVKDMTLPIISE